MLLLDWSSFVSTLDTVHFLGISYLLSMLTYMDLSLSSLFFSLKSLTIQIGIQRQRILFETCSPKRLYVFGFIN